MMAIYLKIWKRVITNQNPLSSSHQLSSAISLLPFTLKPQITFSNFFSQRAAPSTAPPDRVVVKEFLLNKCGLTEEDITKAFRHCNHLFRAKSTQNLEENLELLNGCGLTTAAHIRRVVFSNPQFLFSRSERNIKPKLSLLRTFMKEDHISKLVIRYARIFNRGEDKLKSTLSLLQRLGVEGQALSELVVLNPRFLTAPEEKITESVKQAENLQLKKGSKRFALILRAVLGVGKENIDRRLQCLSSSGFTEEQISQVLPWALPISAEKMKRNVEYVVNNVGLSFTDFVNHPFLFGLSLEKRMIPRYRLMEALKAMKILKTDLSYPSFFTLSEERFFAKYVNFNLECSSVLMDIYPGGNAGKLSIGERT